MEFMVLDSNYYGIAMVDTFKSAIWTVRYDEAGDFELVVPVRKDYLDAMQIGNYLWRRDSDRLMIIETIEIDSNAEDGPEMTVSGGSLESILKRRIVSSTIEMTSDPQSVVRAILSQNVINSGTNRQIPLFTYKTTSDTRITNKSISVSIRGDTVYDAIVSICQEQKIGWRVLPSGDGGFEFELYMGTDRSYDQEENPYVVFSPSFENLYSSNYLKSYEAYKNVVYSIGTYQKENTYTEREKNDDGEWVEKEVTEYIETEVSTWQTSEDSEPTGLARRECFLDNGGVNEGEQGGEESTWVDVAAQKGKEELAQYKTTTAFEGELDAVRQYVLGEDFDIGDIVQVENEFGIMGTVYISEIVFSHDETGLTITPTFVTTEEETT